MAKEDFNQFLTSPTDFMIAADVSSGFRIFTIPGRHEADISTTQLSDVSMVPSTVTLPRPEGTLLKMVSTDAGDVLDGGGVEEVDIHYLDNLGHEQCETIATSGLTSVDLVSTDVYDVQWMHATKVTAFGDVALGDIKLVDVTSGLTIYEMIAEGGNQSMSCRFKIPAGHNGYIKHWSAAGLKRRIDFYLRATCERFTRELVPDVFLFQDFVTLEATSGPPMFVGHAKLPPLCIVKVSALADAAGGEAGCSMTILLEKIPEPAWVTELELKELMLSLQKK